MRRKRVVTPLLVTLTLLSLNAMSLRTTASQQASTQGASRQSFQDWPTGAYRVVEGWPKPLPDTRHSHDGWTWGSFGGVYFEPVPGADPNKIAGQILRTWDTWRGTR